MNSSWDVAILGGGPAGAATAIWSAQRGLATILLEARSFPREAPGETLPPGVEPILDQLGVLASVHAAGFRRHDGYWVCWRGGQRFQAFGHDANGPWRGMQAWRAKFDEILLEKAKEAGVDVRQPCAAIDVQTEAGRVTGVVSGAGEIPARYVVDATGRHGWLQRRLRLPLRLASQPLIATFGYCSPFESNQLPDDSFTMLGDGWQWIARVDSNLLAWTRLSFSETCRCVPKELQHLSPVGKIRGADVTWRIVDSCAGSGYFLAGDAASVLDPAASHGVMKGLMSGMLVADLICRIGKRQTSEAKAIEMYRSWVRDWFDYDVARLRELYRSFEAPFPDHGEPMSV